MNTADAECQYYAMQWLRFLYKNLECSEPPEFQDAAHVSRSSLVHCPEEHISYKSADRKSVV